MGQASRMDITFKDAKKLWSGIWHKEELVNKKRRWLMQRSSQDTSQVGPKKLKKLKSLSNRFLDESFVRKDEVSAHAVKINIENHRSKFCDDESLLEVQNYMVLSDVLTLQSCIVEPSNLEKFHSILDLLSKNALGLLANIVTKDTIKFERTRPRMKKIIKDHFSDTLSTSNDMNLVAALQLLSEILINPKKIYEKQPSFSPYSCSSDLSFIYKALELLDSMPIFALYALNLKLRGIKVLPQFPPTKKGYNKKLLVNMIRKRCQDFISSVTNGNSMPEELGKALSVIHLFFKHKTKSSYSLTSKFLSSSKEKVILQNDILNALWFLPNVTSYQLKYLQSILDLKLGDDSSSFKNDLKHYLMQYLFACDEIDIPSVVSDILACLNQSACSQTQKCSKETIEEETEAVLNVSVELKQIALHLELDNSTDDMTAEEQESDGDTSSNNPQFSESDFCLNPVRYEQVQENELECTGDSMPGTSFISSNSDSCSGILHSEVPKDIHGCVRESKRNFVESKDCSAVSDVSIKELCDETSLVSYRIIDHMLNDFLTVENGDVSIMTKDHLTCQASPSINFQGQEDISNASGGNEGIKVLLQSIKDLLPSITKRCSQRVKKLVKKP